MGRSGSRQGLAIFLLLLFAISTQSYYFSNSESNLATDNQHVSEVLGQEEKIAIGSYPYGAVEKVKISIPDGQVVQSMNCLLYTSDAADE